jgi:hypothetical protein
LEDRCVPSTVTNLDDAGAGSLRQALLDTPAGGTVDFQPGLTGTIMLTSGELVISRNLTIAGPGADVIAVSGNHASRVFDILSSAAISGLTIADGMTTDFGGGIVNDGPLTLTDSIIRDNSASYAGGISSFGTLTISGCTFIHNSTTAVKGFGGGIDTGFGAATITDSIIAGNSSGTGGGLVSFGQTTINRSTISGNFADSGGIRFGAGVYNSAGTMTITSSTINGNSTSGNGGGIINFATLSITNSTISGNSAGDILGGGGIYDLLGRVQIQNTIIAGNKSLAAATPDIGRSVVSQGHNLIGDGTGGRGYTDTDLVGTAANPIDPRLGPLQDNGGPTPTQALLVGSPAIDAGDNTDAPPTDQRGAPRIFHGTIDIGAYEVQAAPRPHATVAQSLLWPPDQRLVNVGLAVQLNADADPSTHLQVQVYADDQASPADAGDIGPSTLQLRATRQGTLLGRVYLIVTSAADASGHVGMSVASVVVPGHRDPFHIGLVRLEAALARGWVDLFHTIPAGFHLLGEGPGDGGAAPPSRQSETSAGIGDIVQLTTPIQATPRFSANGGTPLSRVEAIARAEGFPPDWTALPADGAFAAVPEEGSRFRMPRPAWPDAVPGVVLDVLVRDDRLLV